jgi:hypothetical protein
VPAPPDVIWPKAKPGTNANAIPIGNRNPFIPIRE